MFVLRPLLMSVRMLTLVVFRVGAMVEGEERRLKALDLVRIGAVLMRIAYATRA